MLDKCLTEIKKTQGLPELQQIIVNSGHYQKSNKNNSFYLQDMQDIPRLAKIQKRSNKYASLMKAPFL